MIGGFTHTIQIWLLIAVNFLGFILGTIITSLSFYAYRSHGHKSSLRNATIGFGFLTLGTAIEPAYQIGIERTLIFASEQNIILQVFEGIILALGFLLLFFSIYKYNPRRKRQNVSISGVDNHLIEDSD